MENKISERHARSLLQITDNEEQVKWLNKIINERLTVRDLEKKLKGQKEEEGPIININPNMEDIINSAKDILNQNNIVLLENKNTYYHHNICLFVPLIYLNLKL